MKPHTIIRYTIELRTSRRAALFDILVSETLKAARELRAAAKSQGWKHVSLFKETITRQALD